MRVHDVGGTGRGASLPATSAPADVEGTATRYPGDLTDDDCQCASSTVFSLEMSAMRPNTSEPPARLILMIYRTQPVRDGAPPYMCRQQRQAVAGRQHQLVRRPWSLALKFERGRDARRHPPDEQCHHADGPRTGELHLRISLKRRCAASLALWRQRLRSGSVVKLTSSPDGVRGVSRKEASRCASRRGPGRGCGERDVVARVTVYNHGGGS